MSSLPSRPYITFWVWGEPAPCMDSTRAVPPVMFSISRRIRIRFSVDTPSTPAMYFSTYLPISALLRSPSKGIVARMPPQTSWASRAIS